MTPSTLRTSIRSFLVLVAIGATLWTLPLQAQSQQRPGARGAVPSKPSTQKPAAPAPATPKPVEPAPPPPEDVRFRTIYTTGDQRTESVTYIKGARERFEFQDMVLLKQHDQKRIVQISRSANTYLVAPDNLPPAAQVSGVDRPLGVVMVATTIVDTGERKVAFGREARHVKTMIDRQPMAGACDMSRQRIETDGWYIDAVKTPTAAPSDTPPSAGGCNDQINATHNGDPKALGFPIAYTSTVVGEDGKPSVVSMEVSEFEVTTLDASLFEIPQGLNAAMNIGEFGRALSDANEETLEAEVMETPARKPGIFRIGVPELTNKTATAVDTRALRAELVENLTGSKFEVVALTAAPQAELQKRAAERGLDYLVVAEVTELKVSKGGGLGGLMKAASRVAAPAAGPQQESTEAMVAVKLVQPDGKQRLAATAKGKDGNGFSLKSGLGLVQFAGTMYMSMFMGPQMMSRMYRANAFAGAQMGGLGMLGNPALFQMQTLGMGVSMARGIGVDQTAGAASFVMQQAMAMSDAASLGVPGGPSYAESLGEALDNAAKAVHKALEKP